MPHTTTRPAPVEVSRARYHARSSRFVGPQLLDVIVWDHGPGYDRTYSVELDGRHSFGGFARHLDADPHHAWGYELADRPLEVIADPAAVRTFFASAAADAAAMLAQVRRDADRGDEGAREAIYDAHLAGDHRNCRGRCS